jgi:hypothetical protein
LIRTAGAVVGVFGDLVDPSSKMWRKRSAKSHSSPMSHPATTLPVGTPGVRSAASIEIQFEPGTF